MAINRVHCVPVSGQSNSHGNGQNYGTTSGPIINAVPPLPDRLWMWNGGIRTSGGQNGGDDLDRTFEDGLRLNHSYWVPCREMKWGSSGETFCTQAGVEALRDGILPATDAMLMAAYGIGGYNYEALKPGTLNYAKLIQGVERAYHVAIANRLEFSIPCVLWNQGEGNVGDGDDTYRVKLETLQAGYSEDMKGFTGGAEIPLITSQLHNFCAGPTTFSIMPNGQLEAAILNPGKIYCVCPQYILPTNPSDKVHILAEGQAWLGDYLGRCIRRIITGVPPSENQPLYATLASRSAHEVLVKFNLPPGASAILFDTSWVSETGVAGFRFKQTGGNVVAGTGIALHPTLPDTVILTLNGTPTGTDQLVDIALDGVAHSVGGPTTGPRSTLRANNVDVSASGRTLYDHVSAQRIYIS